MKRLLISLLNLSILTISCNQDKLKSVDLPSKELIDSVILAAIKQDSIIIVHSSIEQRDSLIKRGFSPAFYNLNSKLLEWNTPLKTDINGLKTETKTFNYTYFKSKLFHQDNMSLFSSADSSFINYQINQRYPDTLNLRNFEEVSYTNDKEIAFLEKISKRNCYIRFQYCQISKPLFNRTKSISIVGLSKYDLISNRMNLYQGGYFLILRRVGKDWIKVTNLDWWNSD
jgi:hypothetical protein